MILLQDHEQDDELGDLQPDDAQLEGVEEEEEEVNSEIINNTLEVIDQDRQRLEAMKKQMLEAHKVSGEGSATTIFYLHLQLYD